MKNGREKQVYSHKIKIKFYSSTSSKSHTKILFAVFVSPVRSACPANRNPDLKGGNQMHKDKGNLTARGLNTVHLLYGLHTQ
jgi:hypothetical protein